MTDQHKSAGEKPNDRNDVKMPSDRLGRLLWIQRRQIERLAADQAEMLRALDKAIEGLTRGGSDE